MREKAEGSEPIVERDDDRALLRQPRAVVPLFAAEPGEEPAAVDPYHHRASRRARVQRARPDVEKEAILGDAGREGIDVGVRLVLDAVPSELLRGSDSIPWLHWLGWLPPQLPYGRRGVWNAAEHHHAGGVEALDGAGVDCDARSVGDARCAKGGEDGGPDHGGPHHKN